MAKTTNNKLKKDCPPENVFYVCNGSVLKNIDEMLKELEKMDENAFRHHVNESKNDFSNWIKDIFKEAELAEKIQSVMDKNQIVEIIRTTAVPAKKKPVKR
jgi:L-lactate utilization protein LutB